MSVGDLLPRLSGVAPTPEAPVTAPAVRDQLVTAIAHDSRDVARGTIFVAVRGQRFDGARFASEAATRGAVLVVAASMRPDDARVPWLRVPYARVALAELAAAFYGDPSGDLTVVGGDIGQSTHRFPGRRVTGVSVHRLPGRRSRRPWALPEKEIK